MAWWAIGFVASMPMPGLWVAIAVAYHRWGTDAAIAVNLVGGIALAWYAESVSRRCERLAVRWFGPREAPNEWGTGSAYVWAGFSPLLRAWGWIVYAFIVVAPLVQLLSKRASEG
jgi:hypothetical protein